MHQAEHAASRERRIKSDLAVVSGVLAQFARTRRGQQVLVGDPVVPVALDRRRVDRPGYLGAGDELGTGRIVPQARAGHLG